ncbi:uncharacterized protein LOC130108427 isoform X2 [Lampris incognitus]|uniref:uncharacterized protein LOC130108427 isoform X2 n=1 Tax=Lampris incognitus TaxID=2546036 RepID=UPI0024B55C90|nr:uncharacterized protein LOC130108427 isoform X2 [Lampris incognitus]
MVPQLLISTYSEQFGSPGRGRPARPRPSSAHRRNNPHPRPDFLFPRRLQAQTVSHPVPPVSTSRPLFPPVRHLSFHSPGGKPENTLNAADTGGTPFTPAVRTSTTHALPSADALQKVQLTNPSDHADILLQTHPRNPLRHFQQRPDDLKNVRNHSAGGLRQFMAINPQMGLQTRNPPAAPHHLPHTQPWRSRSNITLDSCGYSCFHVVNPFQAGHYIIHPEFVSEFLR